MITQDPKIARLGHCGVRWCRHIVWIGKTFFHFGLEKFEQFIFVESQEGQIEAAGLQVPQFDRQQIVVPVGQFGCLVVGDPVCLNLLGGEVLGNVDRNFFDSEFLSGFEAGVPADDYSFCVDDDCLAKANSRIDAATASTASSLMRGLFG